MKTREEKGYAIIMMVVLSAVLMISLSTAIAALVSLRKQNSLEKLEFRHQEKAVNSTVLH